MDESRASTGKVIDFSAEADELRTISKLVRNRQTREALIALAHQYDSLVAARSGAPSGVAA